jgi:hypothetical protein
MRGDPYLDGRRSSELSVLIFLALSDARRLIKTSLSSASVFEYGSHRRRLAMMSLISHSYPGRITGRQ